MIKIENVYTGNWEAAIRGMRNPMNSWEKSDSYWQECDCNCHICMYENECATPIKMLYIIGPNDLKLAKQLATSGTDHSKFMRMIIFSCDITAPLYWWKEMDTYKVGTVRNSCSTMHKIASKGFSIDDFSIDRLYNRDDIYSNEEAPVEQITSICEHLNYWRKKYISDKKEKTWYQLIQLLPSSYNQRGTWTANYAVLRNIYHARKNHKLQEWHDFCRMIETLPYSELITED